MFRQPLPSRSAMDLPDIPSPCIAVCELDPVSRLCRGCLRSPQEIARWPYADNAEKLAIVEQLRARRRALGRTSPADSRPRRRSADPQTRR
jgi:predicted Fe-S protein YdhL (DUF1289 family)